MPVRSYADTGSPTPLMLAIRRGIAAGMTDAEIAAHLTCSVGTIKSALSADLVRSGARNRAHLIAIAHERGEL